MKIYHLLIFAFIWISSPMLAQQTIQNVKQPTYSFNNGLGFTAPDSNFSVAIRFRIQNRVGCVFTEQADGSWELTQSEFRVRRMRLRFDGFILNPKWSYAVQLSFSRADMDWDNSAVPNVLRDAMIFYRPNKHLTLGFGQGKLPGNRQRVVSSGEQQFADRSLVNATFNIDRDFGVNASYLFNTGKPQWIVRTAITGGEGRNEGVSGFNKVNPGLCYTGRLEFLPFGAFDKRGDYSEADLAREQTPKLSIAGGWCYNERSERTGGTLGRALFSPVSTHSLITDALFKFKGLSIYGEYIQRTSTTSPITLKYDDNGDVEERNWVYTGTGILAQAGYLFKNNYEIAGRYAQISPMGDVRQFDQYRKNYAICFSKYLKGHKLKLQTDFTFEEVLNGLTQQRTGRSLAWRFQIEMGL